MVTNVKRIRARGEEKVSAEVVIEEALTSAIKPLILLALYEKASHGYEIKKRLENSLRRPVSPAHIYPFLIKLKKEGYVRIVVRGKRKKKVYTLTKKGRELVEMMIDRMTGILDAIIEAKVTVCANCGCKIYESGFEVEVLGRKMVFCCKHCASNYISSLKRGT